MDKNTDQDVITVDIKPFIGPVANIISACIIAGAILISGGVSIGRTPTAANTGDTVADDTQQVAGATLATTSIDDDPVLGNKDTATVAIVEFSDYECPFCQRFWDQTLTSIKANYVETGKAIFVYRDLPLSFHEPAASLEANITECADDQGGTEAFYAMHDYIFENTATNGAGVPMADIVSFANSIGLDGAKIKSCAEANTFGDEIAADTADAGAIGINGTPGFVVGTLNSDGTVDGEIISGAQPFSVFQAAIEKYL